MLKDDGPVLKAKPHIGSFLQALDSHMLANKLLYILYELTERAQELLFPGLGQQL